MGLYRVDDLDRARIGAASPTSTRWYVLTGAAACGKTTLLRQLESEGFAAMRETARWYFDRELAAGRSLADLRSDDAALQCAIAALQRRAEEGADPGREMFLDRALPDSLAFYRIVGLDPNGLLPDCLDRRYAGVFILDSLHAHRSATLGPEDERSSVFLDEWLERDYRTLGYDVVRVPAIPPAERLAFVLDHLQARGSPPS